MANQIYKWKESGVAFVVAARYKKYNCLFNPHLELEKWPVPFRLKITNSPSEPGQFLDQLAIGLAFPKFFLRKRQRAWEMY